MVKEKKPIPVSIRQSVIEASWKISADDYVWMEFPAVGIKADEQVFVAISMERFAVFLNGPGERGFEERRPLVHFLLNEEGLSLITQWLGRVLSSDANFRVESVLMDMYDAAHSNTSRPSPSLVSPDFFLSGSVPLWF